ncbi:putative disease resistance protein At5g05400 [Camellia sinensis]|uniref:putative disease resistance protein At5g05400 n=1 Tax=Camellia sinensis TaxID=4442 RepID=UPI0010359342|nr:putative disease resistance protein At5g05400 [Camellia sinensis]
MCSPQTILDKIVDKIVDKVIQSVVCHIRFVTCYKGNLEKLDAKKDLEDQWQKVNDEVDKYKTLGEDIEANVSNWQTEADKMIREVEEFVNHKTNKESMQCFKFSCPDYISRYKLSKQAERKIGDIKNLTQKGKFDKVAHPKPAPQKLLFPSSADFVSLDYMIFDSRESIFERIMDALKDSKVYKIGVHGLGGVGKTKMVEEVGKQVKKDGLFDEVVMAVVSQDANVRKIQLQSSVQKRRIGGKEKKRRSRTQNTGSEEKNTRKREKEKVENTEHRFRREEGEEKRSREEENRSKE